MDVSTRMVTHDDVPALVELLRRNRDALAPWDPTRTNDYFTANTPVRSRHRRPQTPQR